MKNFLLYCHSGSDNRGCEAIVRSTKHILENNGYTAPVQVFSAHPEEDEKVGLNQTVSITKSPTRSIPEIPVFLRAVAKLYNKLFHTEKLYYLMTDKPFRKYDFKDTIAFHIGGDHYCYEGTEVLALHNLEVKKKGGISVLWGCSVEPSFLQKPDIVADLKRYDLITARESITYDALIQVGVKNVKLYPDPAFTLGYKENSFSENMGTNTVGINMSTYALGKDEIGFKNYVYLANWILENTDMDICLIPHVFKSHSNDLVTNQKLYDAISDKSRVSMITDKLTAEKLKAVIRKCRYYIGARTHSTIAAYSSCVPTLVVGYSVKANGIAKDIFGSYQNYVVSIQNIKSEDELTNSFVWMRKHEAEIRNRLECIMPSYIQSAFDAAFEFNLFTEEQI